MYIYIYRYITYIYIYIYICIIYIYLIYNLLAFNSPLFRTYFLLEVFTHSFGSVFLTLSSWQQWALQGDTLHIGVIQIRCIWGTSIVNRQCWIFLDEPQSFFYACLSFRLSVQFYTCFELIVCFVYYTILFTIWNHLLFVGNALVRI